MTDTLIPSVPATPPLVTAPVPGTIDITDLVEKMRETWVSWAVNALYLAAIAVPGLGWLGWPVISTVFRAGLTWLANVVSNTAEQQIFYMNTAVRKASQAIDYINAVQAKNALPDSASQGDYYAAEQVEISAFSSFVKLTS